MIADALGYPGKTVAGQVDQPLPVPEMEKVHELRATGRLARAGELAAVDDDVDRTRLAGVRPPGDRDLDTAVRHELLAGVGALYETGIGVLRHGGMPRGFRV